MTTAALRTRVRGLSVPRTLGEMNPRLLVAIVVALMFHGGLTLSGSFHETYDAWIHIFMGDRYARSWFDPWEPRWYTGFLVTSYPPGTHQSMALLSKIVDFEHAFVIVQTFSVTLATIGMYRFTKIWYDEHAAGYAALAFVFSSAISETVHVFGQLPTTASLGMLLNALPFGHKWVVEGGKKYLFMAISVTAATTAAHHVTTLFGSVFFLAPTILAAGLTYSRFGDGVDRSDWTLMQRLGKRIWAMLPAVRRAAVLGFGTVMALVMVVLPYWLLSKSDPIAQVPIPHGSRANFLEETNLGLVFWVIPWGFQLVALPYVFIRMFKNDRWPLAASIALLTLLGTGGTTPYPRMLLGGAFDILTLDRFTFWAVMLTIPSLGAFAYELFHGSIARKLHSWFSRPMRQLVQFTLPVGFILLSLLVSNFATYRPLQPAAIDPDPIVSFMEKDQHYRWRYLPLGFGDQMAWISAQMEAQTVDGNYHSARRLPELTSTSIERLEGAKFRGIPGIGSLQQFLAVPDKYALKFVFSNDQFYDPLLHFSGWHKIGTLINGIVVWEREDIAPLPEVLPRKVLPAWQRAMWGTLPMTAYCAAFISFFFHGTERIRRKRKGLHYDVADQRIPKIDFTAIPRSRRLVRVSTAALVGLVGLSAMSFTAEQLTAPPTPEEVIDEYYEDLAFGRMHEVWEALDPKTRPTFEQYMVERSVEDGLIASYSIFNTVETERIYEEEDYIVLTADAEYVTSLAAYHRYEEIEMHRRAGRWYIAPPVPEVKVPPERFLRRSEVVFAAAGRRRVTTGTTAEADVLARPQIYLQSARLVRVNDRVSMVGELYNLDADPADITVSAQLLDLEGEVITQYNAVQAIVTKIRSMETTPWRVDFEGVAGAFAVEAPENGDFHPEDYTPPPIDLDDTFGAVEVYSKAVVTDKSPTRGLSAYDVAVEPLDSGFRVSGSLLNLATTGATVPHILVTLYDEDGRVMWVEHKYLPVGFRPGHGGEFFIDVVDAAEIEVLWDDVRLFTNGVSNGAEADQPTPPPEHLIELPDGYGYDSMRLTVVAYRRAD